MSLAPLTDQRIPLVRRAWAQCVARLFPLKVTDTPTPSSRSLCDMSEEHFRRFIYNRYTEPQRHYHTIEHLEEMLGYLVAYEAEHGWHGTYKPAMAEELSSSSGPPKFSTEADRVAYEWTGTVLLLSVLFHDVVYDPTRGDNEEASALVAAEFLKTMQRESGLASSSSLGAVAATSAASPTSRADSFALPSASDVRGAQEDMSQQHSPSLHSETPLLWVDEHATEFVRTSTISYILKTKEHLSVEPKQPLHLTVSTAAGPASATSGAASGAHQLSRDDPLHVFLDLDLSILGHPDEDTYRRRYADNIRREYSHYARADFLKGRADFLSGLAQHPQWYKTPYFFYRLEAHARHNTAHEVKSLTAELAEVQSAP
ncbi:hypothetical protein LSCM1_03256 [Leishmania martiniquensis]|uniref:Hd phosphohydrolase family protein n=1 Tax=Leishmania martiniquensis TaxID=1580590 RepID=A0A836KHK9_9TRYP|nr:hypothetical protein LSCM1_03256 [Leishmania martiniquensis]